MLLQLKNISKGFGNPDDPAYRRVLDDLSLQVSEGEHIAILGPSGSGKTTLLNLIGALDHPDAGSVFFKGENITSRSRKEMDSFRNEEIGFVFQFHHLLPQCTVLENVLIPTLMIRERNIRQDRVEWAEQLLNRVGIWDHRDKLPGKLSGGECQRAAVVRAMINRPSLLLADEPTGALDRENVRKMSDLLIDLNQNDGLTLLVVTHAQSLAGQMGKTYEIREGKLNRQ